MGEITQEEHVVAAMWHRPGEQAGLLPCGRWRSRQTLMKRETPLCIGATVKHEVHKLESGFISWDHGIIAEVGRDSCSEQDQLQQVSQDCDQSGFK